jgi:multimeric flavodoxin WrbA
MKVLGLCCGRKMGNSEILVKEALMGTEELGMEVEIVRLLDLKIKPCKGCLTCHQSLREGGSGECVIKDDDLHFLDERIMECDGLILGVPVYSLTPPGYLKVINDRMGPSHDVGFRMEANKIRIATGRTTGKGPDERSFKPRTGAFIAVGGSKWVSMVFPLMHIFAFPLQITIVDQFLLSDTGKPAAVVLNNEALKRARKLGRNVAEAMIKPNKEAKFRGDESGTCPICHSNLLLLGKKTYPVECPVCGIKGTLKIDGDEITVTFSEEEQKRSRLTLTGKLEHWNELERNAAAFMQKSDIDEIPKRLEKYKSYKSYSLP